MSTPPASAPALRRVAVVAAAMVGVVVLGACDWLTGTELRFYIFY